MNKTPGDIIMDLLFLKFSGIISSHLGDNPPTKKGGNRIKERKKKQYTHFKVFRLKRKPLIRKKEGN